MSDPNIFGNEFYRMSFKEAIEKKILVDYKIIAIGVSDKEINRWIKTRKWIADDMTIDEIANHYALEKVMQKYNANHAITFHSRVNYAKDFSEIHSKEFPETFSNYICGAQTTGKRSIILNNFKERKKASIANARCLTEGVDIPDIDLVYFCDPKNSKIDIVQASGRALRLNHSRNKELGYIVVPIYHKDTDKLEDAINTSVFKNVIQVVRALTEHDERLQYEINKINYGKSKRKNKLQHFELLIDGTPIIILENITTRLKSALFDQIIEKVSNPWDLMYSQLIDFYNEFGNFQVSKYNENYKALYFWAARQRYCYRKNILPYDKIKKLNSINFNWDTGYIIPEAKSWDQMYNECKEYFQKTGSFQISKNNKDNKRLCDWMITQRKYYKNNKLSHERIIKLEAIGFYWVGRASFHHKWDEMLNKLKEFKKKHGNFFVPDNIEYKQLYHWFKTTRKKIRENKLSLILLDELKAIGFNLIEYETHRTWELYFQQLIDFKKKFKHCNVSQVDPVYKGLGKWLNNQRYFKDKNLLSIDQIEKLNQIGIIWDPLEENFIMKIQKLKKFYEENGHFNIPKDTDENKKLAYWLWRIKKYGTKKEWCIEFEKIGINDIKVGGLKRKKRQKK